MCDPGKRQVFFIDKLECDAHALIRFNPAPARVGGFYAGAVWMLLCLCREKLAHQQQGRLRSAAKLLFGAIDRNQGHAYLRFFKPMANQAPGLYLLSY